LLRSSNLLLFGSIYGHFPSNLFAMPRCLALALHVPVIFMSLALPF
jgi:hypothetical protein